MGKYAKCIVAAAAAGLAALGTALADDTITRLEWVGVAVAVVGALGLTYAVPNKTAEKAN